MDHEFSRDDHHYRRLREEFERSLDRDAWLRSRGAGGTSRRDAAPVSADEAADLTNNAPVAPRDEGVARSLGRAVAEVFTAPESAGSDDARERRALRERYR